MQKTQHYALNQYDPGDTFLRTDFNADNAKLDAALAEKVELYFGSYTGDGAYERFIDLGFTPKAVILESSNGYRPANVYTGGIVLPNLPLYNGGVTIVENGFIVKKGNGWEYNSGTHYYIAFK